MPYGRCGKGRRSEEVGMGTGMKVVVERIDVGAREP